MLLVISPSKTMTPDVSLFPVHTQPLFEKEVGRLVAVLQQYDREGLAALMKMSDKLAEVNFRRFQEFSFPHTPDNSRQALFMFQGDQFQPMDVDHYGQEQLKHAQDHLRILSGLYGMLRPLDLMQPYRLEMAVKLGVGSTGSLYEFWRQRITNTLNAQLENHTHRVLVNLASAEYFKVINKKELQAEILTLAFKQEKAGKLKTVAIHAKRARGAMVDYMISNRLVTPTDLQGFDRDGYGFSPALSSEREWVFVRRMD